MKILFNLFNSYFSQKIIKNLANNLGKGHNRKAIVEGFKMGSSECAKVMAKWRWR